MASNWSLCDVCDNRQITKLSEVWCSGCDKGLCSDCREHHSISKATKYHETVSIAEYKKLPTEDLRIVQVCKQHDKKYELFCRNHDRPCCKKCVKTHKFCNGLTDINEVIKNVKTSNAFYEIEHSLLEVVDNIKRISADREDNLASLENKRREIEAEIKQTRKKIDLHLDKIQYDLLKELMRTEKKKEINKIEKLLTSMKKKENEIAKYQSNFDNIKQYASEFQTFLFMKQIEKDIAVEEKFIQSINTKNICNQIKMSCVINQSLQQIIASIQEFGEISDDSYPCGLSIQNQDTQAQIMVALPTRQIDRLTLMLQRINTNLAEVRGCSLLPDGRMVFSCRVPSKIRVLKSDRSKYFEINNIIDTFDVVFIGDDSFAVTSGSSDKINIFDIKNKKLKKTIKGNSDIDGAVYKDGHLICCANMKGLQIINLKDGFITNVTNNKLSTFAYVTTFGEKLFYTNSENHSVTCCDYHGNILWTFCHTSVLVSPFGISVDKGGNVFVVGWSTHNVVVIFPDGQQFRTTFIP
ncbi:unnamed protein product [Mytilus coruscus]|uniref:B box-type domain-containing protein n=1 Tax=Mytilus coruscus TaxID=42192 RepID=A0A6J8BYK1_MYTCO|nr:unnamed protein product [Mytilus coruscus]